MRDRRKSLPAVLTVKEAAELLGVHINTVRNWSDRLILPAYRIGPRQDRRFPRDVIVAFLEGSGGGGA